MKSEINSNSASGGSPILGMFHSLNRLKLKIPKLVQQVKNRSLHDRMETFSQKSQHFLEDIKSLGFTRTMDELEKEVN